MGMNTARTCPTFHEECVGLDHYPNISIADYGSISGSDAMQKELYNRGPIACSIDATPLHTYESGISTSMESSTNHVVSVVGWGTDSKVGKYWISQQLGRVLGRVWLLQREVWWAWHDEMQLGSD